MGKIASKAAINNLNRWLDFGSLKWEVGDSKYFNEQALEAFLVMEFFAKDDGLGYGPGYLSRQDKVGKGRCDIALTPVKGEGKIIVEIKRIPPEKTLSDVQFKRDIIYTAKYVHGLKRKKFSSFGILTYGSLWYIFKLHNQGSKPYAKLLLFFETGDDINMAVNCILRLQRTTAKAFLSVLDRVHDSMDRLWFDKNSHRSTSEMLECLLRENDISLNKKDREIFDTMYANMTTFKKHIRPILDPITMTRKQLG
jgi:hypothetical protein